MVCASALIIPTVGAGAQRQMIVGLNVGGLYQVRPARIDDNQARAFSGVAASFATRSHRMSIGGIRADHHDDVGLFHRESEILSARGGSEGVR